MTTPMTEEELPKTLRDEFAMAALAGLCADSNVTGLPAAIEDAAYRLADAMLVERAALSKASQP